MIWRVLQGDALTTLRELEAGSVQTCVTSPPYFGLRDYGTATWEGGDEACDHRHDTEHQKQGATSQRAGRTNAEEQRNENFRAVCGKCAAHRIDSQIGLEPTPDEYVAALVEVFREVRRVLRDDGTLWLNLGDSYAHSTSVMPPQNGAAKRPWQDHAYGLQLQQREHGCKPKDLLGIPWMVAFALRADGWYLRSDIIWAKPNPMPESVTDRPTKAHEYLFLLSKSPRYFYDSDAIREDAPLESRAKVFGRGEQGYSAASAGPNGSPQRDNSGGFPSEPGGRNKRSVWTVATQPFPGAHFAVFPPKLIEPCVLAGSSEQACGVCGAPWRRVVERTPAIVEPSERRALMQEQQGERARTNLSGTMRQAPESRTLGFEPSCDHQDGTGSSVVLDPFNGAGTTGLVATRHGRGFVGIELNPEYADMARHRIRDDAPLINYLSEAAA